MRHQRYPQYHLSIITTKLNDSNRWFVLIQRWCLNYLDLWTEQLKQHEDIEQLISLI
jgi:hypothetical protein